MADQDTLIERIEALGSTPVGKLRAEWQRLHGHPPPDGLGRSLLARGIAYRWQEAEHGGLATGTVRELARLAQQLERSGDLDVERQLSLKMGTRLIREWHGRTCRVMVLDEGFEYEGLRFASLTQIARHITGTNWSGPRFFGLRTRSSAPDRPAHA